MLGIIGGTSLLYADLPELEKKVVPTPFGPAEVHFGDIALLMRHQFNTPPHRINFPACLSALKLSGVDRIVAFGSVGSLNRSIGPGSVVLPDDYLSMSKIPTIFNSSIGHASPSIDAEMHDELSYIVPEAVKKGTYVQTDGPRLETRAEIMALKDLGDVVGMTISSEATIANELSIPFAAVCMVDNFCHGLGAEELSYEYILEKSRTNKETTEKIFEDIIERLG